MESWHSESRNNQYMSIILISHQPHHFCGTTASRTAQSSSVQLCAALAVRVYWRLRPAHQIYRIDSLPPGRHSDICDPSLVSYRQRETWKPDDISDRHFLLSFPVRGRTVSFRPARICAHALHVCRVGLEGHRAGICVSACSDPFGQLCAIQKGPWNSQWHCSFFGEPLQSLWTHFIWPDTVCWTFYWVPRITLVVQQHRCSAWSILEPLSDRGQPQACSTQQRAHGTNIAILYVP